MLTKKSSLYWINIKNNVHTYIINVGMYFFYKKGRLVNMNKDKREKEDATKYGEFVSSYFGWVSPEKQKDIR